MFDPEDVSWADRDEEELELESRVREISAEAPTPPVPNAASGALKVRRVSSLPSLCAWLIATRRPSPMSLTKLHLRTFCDGPRRRPRRAPVASLGATLGAPWPSLGTGRRRAETARSRSRGPPPRRTQPNRSRSPNSPACSVRCPASPNGRSLETSAHVMTHLRYPIRSLLSVYSPPMSLCTHVYRFVGFQSHVRGAVYIYIHRCYLGQGCEGLHRPLTTPVSHIRAEHR